MQENIIHLFARMSSERLPGKVTLPIWGKALVSACFTRVSRGHIPVVGLFPDASHSAPLIEIFEENNWRYVLGSELDLRKRTIVALEKYPAKIIHRVTADNPLVCSALIDLACSQIGREDKFFLTTSGAYPNIPKGLALDTYTTDFFFRNYDKISGSHLVGTLRESNLAKKLKVLSHDYVPKANYSIDTYDDYEQVKGLLEKFSINESFYRILEKC